MLNNDRGRLFNCLRPLNSVTAHVLGRKVFLEVSSYDDCNFITRMLFYDIYTD